MTTTDTNEKTLDAIYCEAAAETMDYHYKAAVATRESVQKRIAEDAEKIAAGEFVGFGTASYVEDYRVAREVEAEIGRLARWLQWGEWKGERPNATPAERIDSLRKWVEQETRSAVEGIARGWDLAEPHKRATCAGLVALRDADRDGWAAAREAMLDPDAASYAETVTAHRKQIRETEQARDRARNADRIADYEREIERMKGILAYAVDRQKLYRDVAEDSVARALGSRIFPTTVEIA